MRLAVTADLHYDLGRESLRARFESLRQEIFDARPDVLVLAGDQVGLGKKHLAALLEPYRSLEARKLIVPGNHDVWLPEGDCRAYYDEDLPALYRSHDFEMLDAGPVVVDRVGFAGVMGWYDYSWRDPTLALARGDSYEHSRYRGHVHANDKIFVRFGCPDVEFSARQVARLERQLTELSGKVDRVVAVTHMAAFEEALPAPRKDEDRFGRAYLGSPELGRLLLSHTMVTHHFHGHIHHLARVRKGGLESVSVGCTYHEKRVEFVDL